jgi:hypothetical protein
MTKSDTSPLAPSIVRCLHAVRSLLRRYVVVQGALLVVLWLLVVFWLGGLLDYLPVTLGSSETPRWVRGGLLAIMAVGSGWILWRWVLRRLRVGLKESSLALLIERRYPQLNNELVTAVELSRPQSADVEADISNPAAHRAMLERVRTSVAARMDQVHVAELFDWQPLWALGVAAALGLVATVIAAASFPDWTGLWAKRLLTLSDQPWPRQANLRADGIVLQVPSFSGQLSANRVSLPFSDSIVRASRGAAAVLQISADASAVVPEVCTMYYAAEDGGRGRANLRRVGSPRDGWQQFTLDGPPLDGLTSDMTIDVVGLDARLRELRIKVVQPPVIVDMKLQCEYPRYLMDSLSSRPPSETIPYRSGVTIPEGTELVLVGRAGSRLSRVEYVVYSTAASPESSDPAGAGEAISAFRILNSEPDGDQFTIPLGSIKSSQVVEVRLLDEFGLSIDQIPRYVITMQPDNPPEVDSRLEGIGLAVTPVAQLPIRGRVVDDHGIAQTAALLAVNDRNPLELPLEVDAEGELKTNLDLEKIAESGTPIAASATLGLVVSASDHYDLDDVRHTGRGQPIQLAVVTADQLLVMLDRQELELRQRLELIIAELEQLRDVLHTLKTELMPVENARHFGGQPLPFAVAQPQDARSESRREQVQRLSSLWAQQSVLQADKSQQELSSVAARVDNLRMQLINNRIDSYDRQERLQSKVLQPLRVLLAGKFEALRGRLAELQTATLSGGGSEQSVAAAAALDEVLLDLETIKASMQDIEDFNEIVDLVRGLLEDQEKVLSQTEEQQRKRILDLLR